LKKAGEVVQEEGGEVVHLFSVVDREEGGRETFQKLGIPYTSLFTLSELL
jgi:orotate phosphoribosyltransferase